MLPASAEARGAPPEQHDRARQMPTRHRSTARPIKPPRWLRWVVIATGFVPCAWLLFAFTSDFFLGTRHFGTNPVKEMEHFTGDWNLRFLVLTLAITPALRLTSQGWLVRYRRIFGLFAFLYIVLHLSIYFVLDVELRWADLVADVLKRKYITLGMMGFLLLVPLALTSTKGWIRRLGSRRWNALHRLVYAAAVLGTAHYWMSVKRDIREPALYALVFTLLLGWRVWQAAARRRRGHREIVAPA